MKNRVYFVRHGQNYANLHHVLSYKLVDFKLTKLGEKQAEQTAAYFKDKKIDKIYSSPLIRAFQTGRAIMEITQAPLEVIEILREVNIGSIEANPVDEESWCIHDQVYMDWLAGKTESRFPNGESYHDLANRFKTMLLKVLSKHNNEEIVFAGHGGIFLIGPKETFPELFDDSNYVRMDNCGIGVMDIEIIDGEMKAEMVAWNVTEHLDLEITLPPAPIGIEEKVRVER